MAAVDRYELRPIGRVSSPLTDRAAAPKQGHEGAPEAVVVLDPSVAVAARDLAVGQDAIVLTWLDRADRDVQLTRPRDDPARPPTGVFSTRSPDRPNPIGLHRVRIRSVDGLRIGVHDLEALDGTPVLDVKAVVDLPGER